MMRTQNIASYLVLFFVLFYSSRVPAVFGNAYSTLSKSKTIEFPITGRGQRFTYQFSDMYMCGPTGILVSARVRSSFSTTRTSELSFNQTSIRIFSSTGCETARFRTLVGSFMPTEFIIQNSPSFGDRCSSEIASLEVQGTTYRPGIAVCVSEELERITFLRHRRFTSLTFTNLDLQYSYFICGSTNFRSNNRDEFTLELTGSSGSTTLFDMIASASSNAFTLGAFASAPISSSAIVNGVLRTRLTTFGPSLGTTGVRQSGVLLTGIKILRPLVIKKMIERVKEMVTQVFQNKALNWTGGNDGNSMQIVDGLFTPLGANRIFSNVRPNPPSLLYSNGSEMESPVLNREAYITFRPSPNVWISSFDIFGIEWLSFQDSCQDCISLSINQVSRFDQSVSTWKIFLSSYQPSLNSFIFFNRIIIVPSPTAKFNFSQSDNSLKFLLADISSTGRVYSIVFATTFQPSTQESYSVAEKFLHDGLGITLLPIPPPPPDYLPLILGVCSAFIGVIILYFSWRRMKRCLRHRHFAKLYEKLNKIQERDQEMELQNRTRSTAKIDLLQQRQEIPQPSVLSPAFDSNEVTNPLHRLPGAHPDINPRFRFSLADTASRFHLVAPSPSMAQAARRLALDEVNSHQLPSPNGSDNNAEVFENVVVSPLPPMVSPQYSALSSTESIHSPNESNARHSN